MFILEIILTLSFICTTLVLSKKLESIQKQTKTRNEAQLAVHKMTIKTSLCLHRL